jgi:hypothetical protein
MATVAAGESGWAADSVATATVRSARKATPLHKAEIFIVGSSYEAPHTNLDAIGVKQDAQIASLRGDGLRLVIGNKNAEKAS